MSIFFTCNDKFYKTGEPVINPGNRGFRYGDGLFETMKMVNGEIILKSFHFERLISGMEILQFDKPRGFNAGFLETRIKELCKKNLHSKCARIRLSVFRGNGGLYDAENDLPNYTIETAALDGEMGLNRNGLVMDIYPGANKSCDKFSNIKSNNFLPYLMAAKHAQQHKLNDCILLNTYNRICESTIANIFIFKDEIIYTPSLSEGCIAGVTRRWMLGNISFPFEIKETPLSIEDLKNAEEVFLTNSIHGVRWVHQAGKAKYKCKLIKSIHQYFMENIYK